MWRPSGRGIHAVAGHPAGEQIGAARRRRQARQQAGQRKDGVAQARIGHGHIDLAAAPAGARIDHCCEQPDQRRQRAAEQVADLEVRHHRRAARCAGLVEHAGIADVVDVVAGALGIGAVLAVAADRAEDEARIDLGKRLVADAELVHDAGAEALDDDVRRQSQSAEHGDALRLLQVEAQPRLLRLTSLKKALVSPALAPIVRA
jgi:hypothetical protein